MSIEDTLGSRLASSDTVVFRLARAEDRPSAILTDRHGVVVDGALALAFVAVGALVEVGKSIVVDVVVREDGTETEGEEGRDGEEGGV